MQRIAESGRALLIGSHRMGGSGRRRPFLRPFINQNFRRGIFPVPAEINHRQPDDGRNRDTVNAAETLDSSVIR